MRSNRSAVQKAAGKSKAARLPPDFGHTPPHTPGTGPTRRGPLSAEALARPHHRRQPFRRRFGLDHGPDELLFFEAPRPVRVEHQIVEAVKHARLAPALIDAFEQTGLLVTEENQHQIPAHDLGACRAAAARSDAGHNHP